MLLGHYLFHVALFCFLCGSKIVGY
jgi:hypothetical protein